MSSIQLTPFLAPLIETICKKISTENIKDIFFLSWSCFSTQKSNVDQYFDKNIAQFSPDATKYNIEKIKEV